MTAASAILNTSAKILRTGASGAFQSFGKTHRVATLGNSSKVASCMVAQDSFRRNPPARLHAPTPFDTLKSKATGAEVPTLAARNPVSLKSKFNLVPALATLRKYAHQLPSPLQVRGISSAAQAPSSSRVLKPNTHDLFSRGQGPSTPKIPDDIIHSLAFDSWLNPTASIQQPTHQVDASKDAGAEKVAKKALVSEPLVDVPASEVPAPAVPVPSSPAAPHASLKAAAEPEAPRGNIFARLFAALFRIKNQTGKELSDLCGELERRTKTIENILKLNGELIKNKGPLDFTKNEEMKKLIDTMRETGLVDLPVGKYTWTEEEKESLKQQLSFAKERMDRMSQEIQFKLQQSTTEDNTIWETISMIFKRLSQALETVVSNIK